MASIIYEYPVKDAIVDDVHLSNTFEKAIELAMEIQQIDSKSAKWIASDYIKELTDKKIQERLVSRISE